MENKSYTQEIGVYNNHILSKHAINIFYKLVRRVRNLLEHYYFLGNVLS